METGLRHAVRLAALALALPLFAAGSSLAQDTGTLDMELNGLTPIDDGCRATFVVDNRLESDIAKAVFEVALFGESGLVESLITLDFRELPMGRTRVRQFDLARIDCGAISRVLVNDATECSGDGLDPQTCIRDIRTKTATEIAFGS